MVKPTQAQIEAAAKAMWERTHDGTWMQDDIETCEIYLEDAKVGLTAAAEADKSKCVNAHMGGERCVGRCMNPKDCYETPLPAEVGEPTADDVRGILRPDWLHPYTIERCALVAEQWQYDKHPTCKSIAAEIRALKP